jgi:hypothetical protein
MAQFATTAEPDGPQAWPQPDDTADGFGAIAAPDPTDVGFVHDAPPIATAGADTPAGYDMPAGPLLESPALAPGDDQRPAPDTVLPEDIETVAARRAKEQGRNRRFGWPLAGLPTAVLGLILLDLGLIGWRAEIVRAVPQMAPLYAAIGLGVNLRGLVLTDVTTETVSSDGVPVLMIRGQIVSATKRVVDVPRLRFAVRNGSGNEIYSWTALPNRSLLGPGEALAFQSRLASPPPETHDVLVRFFTRRDQGVGIQ